MTDIFLRADSFKGEPWYDELCIFRSIGACKPNAEHLQAVMDALQKMGYENLRTINRNGETYLAGK